MAQNKETTAALTDRERTQLNDVNPLFKWLKFGNIFASGWGRAKIAFGTSSFTTTGTTKAITPKTQDGKTFKKVLCAIACYGQAVAAANGPIGITQDLSSGQLTVSRAAGTDSGAKFSYLVIGY